MENFDPSQTASSEAGLFGLPSTRQQAKLIILPVPWEVTTSYGSGTSHGPAAILEASPQIDLFDLHTGKAYEAGYYLEEIPQTLLSMNDELRPVVLAVRKELESSPELSPSGLEKQKKVNQGCQKMVDWVYQESKSILADGKLLGLIGGDHSSPFGAIRAISEKHQGQFGILHIDAHADLRQAYQGFQYSHASIMHNVMTAAFKPQKLVQVAIRDFCEEEYEFIQSRKDIKTYFDKDLKDSLFAGENWSGLCRQIIQDLPEKVYISFDIDGLSPLFCPNTGTPVPGGLSFDEAVYLLAALVKAKKTIVGFDLNEIAPSAQGSDEWDGNVGARLLYKMCGLSILSSQK